MLARQARRRGQRRLKTGLSQANASPQTLTTPCHKTQNSGIAASFKTKHFVVFEQI